MKINKFYTFLQFLMKYFEDQEDQDQKLSELCTSLLKRNISLIVEYSQTLHDREIK